jgi:hypothetical protein
MRRKIALVCTLTAWLLATGAQWDLVQTFAWARMFAANARTLPAGAALDRTFSPEGRCELCGVVSTAKQQQRETDGNAPGGKPDGKLLLVFQPAPVVVVTAPDFAPWPSAEPCVVSIGRAAPPLPPPRA